VIEEETYFNRVPRLALNTGLGKSTISTEAAKCWLNSPIRKPR
jgi:hypothetical protein